MDGPGAAWRWARRPLWAALASGVIGAGAAQARQPPAAPPAPGVSAPPAAAPAAGGAGAMPAEIPWALQPPSSGPAGAAPPPGPGVSGPAAAPPIGAGVSGPAAALTSPPAPAPAADGKPVDDPCSPCRPPVDWMKVPPVTPVPRPGWFIPPPTGPGYYTLWDLLTGNYRQQPPRFPFGLTSLNAASFFDYDFRYLDNPDNTQADWSDAYKRVHLGDDWLFSTGGELRYRYADELNSRGSGRTNNYDLFRTRVYGDLWYRDEYRVFVEFLYAQTFNQNLAQLPIDATGPDLLNAFVEVKMAEPLGSPAYLRVGRQELLYGSQRLVSTLDWANTRRTFQGVKGYWHTDQFDVDAFWVQPVVPNADRFDSVDTNRNFFGVWSTYRPKPGTYLDLYYLGLTTANAPNNGDVQTLGGRYAGDLCNRWLYDYEGAVQFGERDGRHVFAQMATGGLGYHFVNLPWNPEAWAYYDYASGDKNPTGTGSYRTFNQLFPFGHYYFGWLDLVGRQNIRDLNFQFSTNPQPWVTSVVQYHIFKLDARKDALYNAAGVATRRDPTGLSGDDVGDEIDFLLNFHLTMHQDLLLGYSKLFAGEFWRRTGNPNNPELYYAQYSFRW